MFKFKKDTTFWARVEFSYPNTDDEGEPGLVDCEFLAQYRRITMTEYQKFHGNNIEDRTHDEVLKFVRTVFIDVKDVDGEEGESFDSLRDRLLDDMHIAIAIYRTFVSFMIGGLASADAAKK